jgi:hypothetical protein
VRLPLSTFAPRLVALTLAESGSTEVSAILLPPPASIPAAVAELPILELRAFQLTTDDGSVDTQPFPPPSRRAAIYGVLDNLDGERVRSDLVNNILILPEARLRHRAAIVDLVRRNGLAGIVLDYRAVAGDLQPECVGLVSRLMTDLAAVGADLVVTVPMPRRAGEGWDPSPYAWRELAATGAALRVALPDGTPLETSTLDSLVRWALANVERRRLQLGLPVWGRDIVEGRATAIGYGEALARILDMVASDAPARIAPDSAVAVELPTVSAAELGRDENTGMWRFHYWDVDRRQHTVWLNDAAGLAPAFDIAARYRLGRLALDGVTAGLDPSLWQMVRGYIETGKATPPEVQYRLQWQLVGEDGRTAQQALQPLGSSTFEFRAPANEGTYRLSVNLVTADDTVAALGRAQEVHVAPPPPPAPTATPFIIVIRNTPETVVTAAPPVDEMTIRREPVRIGPRVATAPANASEPLAEVAVATGPLREGPSLSSAKVSDLRLGDRLLVEGRTPDERWLRARVAGTGVAGWVQSDLVELEVPLTEITVLVTVAPPTPAGTPLP